MALALTHLDRPAAIGVKLDDQLKKVVFGRALVHELQQLAQLPHVNASGTVFVELG